MKLLPVRCVFIALMLSISSALDKPRLFQSQIELDQTELIANVEKLQQTVDFYNVTVPDNGCRICQNDKETDRFVKNTLARASGLIRRSSTFSRVKRLMRTKLGRKRYNAKVSAEAMVPMLKATGSYFSVLGTIASEAKSDSFGDEKVKGELMDLLGGVSTSSATFLTNVTNLLQSSNTTTAGMVAMSILSVLEFYERITLSILSVLADYLNVLTGRSVDHLNDKVRTLHASLSTNGVLAPVLDFLRSNGDSSGLTVVLTQAKADISKIELCLDRFTETADDIIAVSTTGGISLTEKSIRNALSMIAGILATTVTSVNSIATGISKDVGAMLGSVLGLMVARMDGILNLFVSTLDSTVSLAVTSKRDDAVSGDTLLFLICAISLGPVEDDDGSGLSNAYSALFCILIGLLPLALVTSPIWIPLLAIYFVFSVIKDILSGLGGDQMAQPFSCYLEAQTCQNNALSSTLLTL